MFFFFFNDTATTEIYTLSLHDALPVGSSGRRAMTITAFEIHEGAIRPAADRLHVNRVIQFDRGRIAYRDAGDGAQRREFGMHLLETIYFSDIPRIRKTAL